MCRSATDNGAAMVLALLLCLVPAGSRLEAQTGEAAAIVILAADYRDLNGDGDGRPDTGETGRVLLTVRNDGPALANATFTMASDDTDVACIIEASAFVSLLASGQLVALGSFDPLQAGLSFRASDSLESEPGRPPAAVTLCLTVSGDGVSPSAPACIDLPADIDLLGGEAPLPVPGPDGISGTADDGVVAEDFDTDRNGDGRVDLGDLPAGSAGALNDTIGVTVGTAAAGTDVLRGIGCSGFHVPPQDPACIIDPDNEMDWHLHCPAGECDNLPLHTTPSDGALSRSGRNSLHWGAHFRPDSLLGDSTHFRQLAAFMTNPINLALDADAAPLALSFFHIASMMDNHTFGLVPRQAVDFGDVQIQVDRGPDPAVDDWGYWEKLVPFQNGYDHIAYIWSTFGISATYCLLTPTDAGPDPGSDSGFRELLCHPAGVWSHCGSPYLSPTLFDCNGPAASGSLGNGLWVETKFGLEPFAGQRIRVRWIGQSWEFDCCASSYQELGGSWNDVPGDDGWWIDDITLSGAVASQVAFEPDAKPPPDATCPPGTCNDLDGDGYGSPADPLCRAGDGLDCAPGDVTVHPDAVEVCDGIDNDCDGVADDLVVGQSTSFSPVSINVNSMGSTFSISTRLTNTCTGLPGDDWRLGTVHISRVGTPSLGSIVLPEPSLDPGCDSATQDGIWEDRPSRSVSGNGVITFRFSQASDGRCETADGNRQDLIALLAGAVDREIATVCYAGIYAGNLRVEDCAAVVIRSRGTG